MINVVFEGPTGAGKTTIVNKLKKIYEKKYSVGVTNDIDKDSPLYSIIENMFEENVLVCLNKKFNTLRYETLLQAADHVYLREKLYSENNDINLFDRSYFSIYSYQSVLMENNIENSKTFMDSVLKCMKSGEKKIDLLVLFKGDANVSLKRSELRDSRKYTTKEKNTLKKFDKQLNEFIRYNNSDYSLLVVDINDSIEHNLEVIKKKIDEIITDKKKNQIDKWQELYQIDIEEYDNPDDYIEYKLKYKKKLIKKILKYAGGGKVLEAGCGTGLLAGYLSKLGLNVTALDLSQKVLDYAFLIAKESNVISPCQKYQQGDILNLKYKKKSFNVIYSNGVFEHFSDDEIIKSLRQQLEISKYVIFGIPTMYFGMEEKMLGNERGLTLKEWKNLIRKANGHIIERSGFHYYKLNKRIIEYKKWFRPKAFWLFIIEKNN